MEHNVATIGKISLTAILAGLAMYFETMAVPFLILAIAMGCDWITGMINAWLKHTLSSKIGIQGIVKKICYVFVVLIGSLADWTISNTGERLGADLHGIHAVALLVIIWLVVNEAISILENLCNIGVPFPAWLKRLVMHLKGAVDDKGESIVPDDKNADLPPQYAKDEQTDEKA